MSKKVKEGVKTEIPSQVAVSIVEEAELEKIMASVGRRGKWQDIIEAIREDGKARKVEGLTRGQISALYRAVQAVEVLGCKCSAKAGYVVIFPLS